MTDKPINLRQARKARDKADARGKADANAALHGRPKALRRVEDDDKRRKAAELDGKKLDK